MALPPLPPTYDDCSLAWLHELREDGLIIWRRLNVAYRCLLLRPLDSVDTCLSEGSGVLWSAELAGRYAMGAARVFAVKVDRVMFATACPSGIKALVESGGECPI